MIYLFNIFNGLCVLLSVAYLTLLERKILGYMQFRKGPNKVSIMGVTQPLSDALKLFMKGSSLPSGSNMYMFLLMPLVGLIVALLFWGLAPGEYSNNFVSYGFLLFFVLSSLNVYIIMLSGWSSNSAYAFLGALRASAQTISYEVAMIFVLVFPAFVYTTYSWSNLYFSYLVLVLFGPSLFLWMICILAETNRAPFDFAEGESELVSGFNVEYSGSMFAFLFLGEYTVIMFMSLATCVWFLSPHIWEALVIFTVLVVSLIVIVRGCFPRLRYDKLMLMSWKQVLPGSMCMLMLVILIW
uniref:NADH-ubiquinone oxidoreductase chain 1 n=1 Tax=Meghimatium bilineatum TaxID=318265 RepID=A0A218KBN2_9EUPU|nr:NADH dehydrogenase subunit 1 [Meghimatium bilineatum]AKK32353.1 NADH dehydrogenase subunit 1 [Meghimatium bilineatum]